MIPFLQSIAKAYTAKYKDLSDFLFLFPNKRSATFFIKYLRENTPDKPFIAPQTITISEFVEWMSHRVVASKIDSLFLLFNCYKQLVAENIIDEAELYRDFEIDQDDVIQEGTLSFANFRKWGETVLSDFNVVDQFLVDPDVIFKNVKDFREITSNFLTEEQKEVLSDIYGQTFIDNEIGFWKNFENDEEELSYIKTKFLLLWRILAPLYERFNEALEKKGLVTPGYALRKTIENLDDEDSEILRYRKVVIIGFNALNTAEFTIFKKLKKLKNCNNENLADFYWDSTGPVLSQEDNGASRFVNKNMLRFPSPPESSDFLKESINTGHPEINIISSPSNVAQAKILGESLLKLKERIGEDAFKEARVAVVLPDENLLIPVLYSVPVEIGDINLTMGYSFRLSTIYSFIQLLKRINSTLTIIDDKATFYNKDLRIFFSHPLCQLIFGLTKIENFRWYLDKAHPVRIPLDVLKEYFGDMADLLAMPSSKEGYYEMHLYLKQIFNFLKEKIISVDTKSIKDELEIAQLELCCNVLELLLNSLEENIIEADAISYLRLFERLISNERIEFEGEPLKGLQIMGTLETRSLDFDYLFILSMNERMMPKKERSKSFIPDSLRMGYGIPSASYAEELFAYYFYRMISRAKEVFLFYDSRMGGGVMTKGVSRYIQQLRYIYLKENLNEKEAKFRLVSTDKNNVRIIKNELIKDKLNRFTLEKGKNFSASSLSDYRQCQVKFFFKSIMNINDDPEPSEFMGPIEIGNVVHGVMMSLYMPADLQNKLLKNPVIIKKEFIESLLQDPVRIKQLVTRYINYEHYHIREKEKLMTPLSGSSLMIGERIEQIIKIFLNYDHSLTPFKLFGTEIKNTLRIKLPSGRIVNFKFAIDRLDEINFNGEPRLRVVDYKTGSVKTKAKDIEDIVKGGYSTKYIFQLFTYAWLLKKSGVKTDKVMMEIYSAPEIIKGDSGIPSVEKSPVTDFSIYYEEFNSSILEMIDEIFENDYFDEPIDNEECKNCSFKMLCEK